MHIAFKNGLKEMNEFPSLRQQKFQNTSFPTMATYFARERKLVCVLYIHIALKMKLTSDL